MALRNFVGHMFQSQARIGDVSDRLSSTWTFLLILILACLSYYENSNNPLSCWCPSHMTTTNINYAHAKCWDSEFHVKTQLNHVGFEGATIWRPKYKWLPLILVIQALLFKIPDVLLSMGQKAFGIHFQKILGLADGYTHLNVNDRGKVAKYVGKYLKNWLESSTVKGIPWGPLTLLYLFTKVLYFVNAVVHLSILDSYLRAKNETSYLHQLARDIANNETTEWRMDEPAFPRIISCEFKVQHFQNHQTYALQCYNNVASYYEALYGFLWVWLLITVLATSLSCGLYGLKVIIPIFRRRYLKLYLCLSEEIGGPPKDHMIADFAGSVTEDGVYILKAIGEVSSEHLVRDVVVYLWNAKYRPEVERMVTGQVAPQMMASGSLYAMTSYPTSPLHVDDGGMTADATIGSPGTMFVSGSETIPLVERK